MKEKGKKSLINGNLLRHGSWFPAKRQRRFPTPDGWTLKRKAQEFCGAPVRFGLRTPKCIDFATCFGLWLVLLSSINWMRTCTTLRSIHRKVKVKNYRLQLVPLLPSASTSPTSTIGAWWNSDLLFIIKFSLSRCYSHCFIYLPLEATMETSDHFHWEFLLLTIVC